MAQDPVQRLEMRIVELENQLKQLRASREAVNLSADEIQAYRKVREALAIDWGDFCGINDCMRCIILRCWTGGPIVRCIRICDVECTCGPCSLGGGILGGGGRFGTLGG
jgi:hypothetical protein